MTRSRRTARKVPPLPLYQGVSDRKLIGTSEPEGPVGHLPFCFCACLVCVCVRVCVCVSLYVSLYLFHQESNHTNVRRRHFNRNVFLFAPSTFDPQPNRPIAKSQPQTREERTRTRGGGQQTSHRTGTDQPGSVERPRSHLVSQGGSRPVGTCVLRIRITRFSAQER